MKKLPQTRPNNYRGETLPQQDGALPTAADDDDDVDAPASHTDAALALDCRQCVAGSEVHGERLDRALVHWLPEFSRSHLQHLIAAGAVSVNAVVATRASARLRAGDHCLIELRPTLQSQAFRPEPIALSVVFEDPHLLVVNKPAGLVVHPAPGNWSGTLLNALLARDACAATLPRAGIVHRLDKDTSGLLLVARTRATLDALVALIAARRVSRQYLALAHHAWSGPACRSVTAAIGRDPRNRLRMAAVDLSQQAGKPAQTDLECRQSLAQSCLVQCRLQTGRTHQIRVHMAAIGHPLLADTLYGGAPLAGLQRQALHAARLALTHPITGAALDLRAAPPPDLLHALQWLGYNAPALAWGV